MRNKKLIVIFSVLCALTLLIIVNSVLFSVQHIQTYCYNGEDTELDGQVLSACGIKTGKSIFFLDEAEVIENVESGVPVKNVKVINIEKKFPNRVYINYVIVAEYFKIYSGGKVFYLSNTANIIRIEDESQSVANDVITLKIRGEVLNEAAGATLVSSDSNDLILINAVASALERVMHYGTALGVLESINLSGLHAETKNFIYFHTRAGAYWELQNISYAYEKLLQTWSAFNTYPAGSTEQSTGTFIMFGNKDNIKVSHRPVNRYADGITATS